MKRVIFYLVLSSTLFSYSQSKSFKIFGSVISEDTKGPLESATIHLEQVKDSTVVTYTISDKNGKFNLEGRTSSENLNLFISYVGYQTYKKAIAINGKDIDLSAINLEISNNALDEVIITTRAPITVKKDTLEFNVKSFKTKKDANVEDLLKKLPGVEVAEDGSIQVNGKSVNKILVNGKPFFGNDPTITTRNLSKDIIEKVQVTDTKTKSEAFTGEKGNSNEKTINLTIKKENNKGVFGRLSAGGGTDERYEYAGMFNRFDNDLRISVLAGGNNINSPGFSFGEIRKMFGGVSSIRVNNGNVSFGVGGVNFGGGQGITRSRNEGINYADDYGKKAEASASYFHSVSDSENETKTDRENILPDTRFFTSSSSTSSNDNDSHRFTSEFEIKPDSTWLIEIKPTFSFSNNKSVSNSFEESRMLNDQLTNTSEASSFNESEARNFRNLLNLTKKIGSKGAHLRINVENERNTLTGDNFVLSNATIFDTNSADPNNPDVLNEIDRDQFTDSDNVTTNFTAGMHASIPLIGKEFKASLHLTYANSNQDNLRSTFDKNNAGDYTLFNEDLSTDFEYTDRRIVPSYGLSYEKGRDRIFITAKHIFRTLKNEDALRTQLNNERHFNNFDLDVYSRKTFSQKSSLSLNYNLRNSAPQLRQLQAFTDVSNPLNIIVGNPDLKPSRSHRLYAYYNNFDFQKGKGFNMYASANFQENQVVSKSIIDENLIRNTTYENVSGAHNINGNVAFNKRVKLDSLKTLRVNTRLGVSGNRSINFNNGIKYASNVTALTPSLGVNFDWREVMSINAGYSISFSNNNYDLDAFRDESFSYHTLRLGSRSNFFKKLEWQNDIRFNYNPNIAPGFEKSAWFWNATLAYSMLKDKASLTLKVYDLLDQNTNARRIATANYIQDSQSKVLQQYFMLSFSWKFNSLGKKGEIRDRGFYRF